MRCFCAPRRQVRSRDTTRAGARVRCADTSMLTNNARAMQGGRVLYAVGAIPGPVLYVHLS